MLRTYGGIFDGPIQINETQLAWILKRDIISIRELLAALHQSGIIDYIPKNDNPQICYLQERIKTEELNIDHENYLLRKKEYIGRIQSMIDYTQSTACRSVMIGKYFGDETITSCGICNNCKALDYQKNKSRIVEENMNQILHLLKSGPTEIKTLSEALNKDETQILDAICFLKNEGVIWINQGGKLEIK